MTVPSTAVGCSGVAWVGLSSLSLVSSSTWRLRRSWGGSAAVGAVGVVAAGVVAAAVGVAAPVCIGAASGVGVAGAAAAVAAAAAAEVAAAVCTAVMLLSTTFGRLVGCSGVVGEFGRGEFGRGLFCGYVGVFW